MKGSKPPPKSKGPKSSPHTSAIKRFVCDFQTSPGNGRDLRDVCMICSFGAKRPLKDVKGTFVAHSCVGTICLKCMQRTMDQQFKEGIREPFCPLCLHIFTQGHLGQIHPALSNTISEEEFHKIEGFVQCRFCGFQLFFQPGDPESVWPEYQGRELTFEQRKCCADFRLRCPSQKCEIEACRNCHAVPYHQGETCEEHRWFVEGYVCRICGRAANPGNAPNGQIALLTCGHPDCVKITEQMCDHVHPCGHACLGTPGEQAHVVCPECNIGGSTCLACEKELWGSPCLTLECGHTIHKACALKIIRRKRAPGVLVLPLCPAPGCGEFIKDKRLEKEAPADYVDWLRLETYVNKTAQQRISAEGIDYHPEVCSKSSPFNRAGEKAGGKAALYWAKKRLRFMLCDNCQHEHKRGRQPLIYTAGRVDDTLPDEGALVCPYCSQYRFPLCQKHKHKYMQFKCETCCSIGTRLIEPRIKDMLRSESGARYAVWNCDICCDMPGRADEAKKRNCIGNCRFGRHQSNLLWGKCAKCLDQTVISKARPRR